MMSLTRSREAGYMYTLRLRREAKGLCIRCGKEVTDEFKTCEECREYLVAYRLKQKRLRRGYVQL